jgi:protein gp37
MTRKTPHKIEWADLTFSPFTNCKEASRAPPAYWKKPLRWDKDAAEVQAAFPSKSKTYYDGWHHLRPRVICAPPTDWLDPNVPLERLADLLDLIRNTPHLDWLLPTKTPETWGARISNLSQFRDVGSPQFMWELKWYAHMEAPKNVWIGATIENKDNEKHILDLLNIPARIHFLNIDPMTGPLDSLNLKLADTKRAKQPVHGINWVIAGGGAKPLHPDWVRRLHNQCKAAGVPFFFKGWGEYLAHDQVTTDEQRTKISRAYRTAEPLYSGHPHIKPKDIPTTVTLIGKKAAGQLLDGMEYTEFPETQP